MSRTLELKPDWQYGRYSQGRWKLKQFEEFSSHHHNNTSFAFCDGSVRLIADNIDIHTFQALGTRAGRELCEGF